MNDEEHRFVMEVLDRPQATGSTVEERLRIVEDIEAVREVCYKYGWYADNLEFDKMLDLYTEDVERVLSGTRTERVVGREALRQIFSGRAPTRDADGQLDVQKTHHIDTDVVKVTGDDAWMVALGQVVAVTAAGQAAHEDVYLFQLRREGGGWRISRQIVVTDNARNPVLH
jgi:ketosteroid isomerase-like protein